MRVLVASDFEPGSHRAHAINVVKTAGGFARLGHRVTVVCRASEHGDVAACVAAYAEPALDWECVPVLGSSGEADRARDFARAVLARARDFDFVYARHFYAGLATARAGVPTALETHAYVGDPNPMLQAAIEAVAAPRTDTSPAPLCIITISEVLRAHYIERGAAATRVAVVPDGVDVAAFAPREVQQPRPFARRFPWHALYAGHLYDYKGIPTILAAAALLPQVGFELVGGSAEDVARVRAQAAALDNVRVHGSVDHREVPRWLQHADALLLPPSAKEPSAAWTSPVKLGEYLASTKPIVASLIPGLRAWVASDVVTWFRPDDAMDLARALVRCLGEDEASRSQRAERALTQARRFDYSERARGILRATAGASALASLEVAGPVASGRIGVGW